jgi:ankyrin repeat protein
MTRQITPQTSLDNLKKEAKRWLKALRRGDEEALARLNRASPNPPAAPGLRDIQHAIALEFGLPGWTSLMQALQVRSNEESPDELANRFIEFACPDHHVRGRPAHRIVSHAAVRLLERRPEIRHHSLYTAIVCGELEEVERRLRAGAPDDASRPGGPKNWQPLLYLCFTRLALANVDENAVAIARLLLDRGADPTVYFMAGDSQYTPLVGVIGEGEEDRPAHSQRDALARLLLARGAHPFDIQVNYNIHFHGKVLWFLELMYEFSVQAGHQSYWDDPEWRMIDMGGYGCGARWYLQLAVQKNDLALAEWCLRHGASANAAPLYREALRRAHTDMADLLARHGAHQETATLDGEDAFIAASLGCDRTAAQALVEKHPEFLRSWQAMHLAVERDREDVVEFLLDLGMSPEVEDAQRPGHRPLHVAAYKGAIRAARLLIKRGAQIDPIDSVHKDTPLFFAMWAQQSELISWLSRYSRDVWALSFTGYVERVREVLRAEPRIATTPGESTPLFWLPEDESKALELVELFVDAGVDVSFRRNEDGMTAAQVARRRGANRVADRLFELETRPTAPASSATVEPEVAKYESRAKDLVSAYAGDADALRRLNEHYGRSATLADLRSAIWGMVYKVRQAGGSPEAFGLAEAQEVMARMAGFPNWSDFMDAVVKGTPPPGKPYRINIKENKITPTRYLKPSDWDTIIGQMKEHRITGLEGGGTWTDSLLKRIAELDFVTSLSLEGARGISEEGLSHLARMPQLEHLNLSGANLTDRGLEVLRQLPELRRIELFWQRGITDAGVAHLENCQRLESVELMGSTTGDGAIRALRGKPNLRSFKTGTEVTDAGLAMLQDFPAFKTPMGGSETHLLIDGPFTNAGLASLSGLVGLHDLDLFWHVTGITSDGFAHLVALPNLKVLGCDGRLSDNVALRHIATLPRLRSLRIQEAVATDEGFVALSGSQTIESIWGRECPNFASRGFVALSGMPTLRNLGIGCQNVEDQALATLPLFPALHELTPIGFRDDGFRHIGRCERLERLVCMYCRDTTDISTEHIAGLQLKSYYAGLTQITDRSLEILGRMTSLEAIEFFETKAVTDAGLAHLVGLPRLRKLDLFGLPNVTSGGVRVFPAHVEVNYDV